MSDRAPDPGMRPADVADELDAAAAATPASLAPTGPAAKPSVAPAVAEAFDRRTAELAPLYAGTTAILTWGFRLGAALLAAGLLLALVRQEPLRREAEPFGEIIPAVLDGRAAGIVDVAILWLVATPAAAVLVIAVGFARLGDRRYAALSALVLGVLGVSIALALTR